MNRRTRGRLLAVALIAPLFGVTGWTATAQEGSAPAALKARLEGTWELEEWHLPNGKVLRPPEIGGRWSNHDGVVLANYHRAGADGFESYAGYGGYALDATTWSYRYERTEVARGTSHADAKVTIAPPGQKMVFKLRWEGDTVILEREGDRRRTTTAARFSSCRRARCCASTARSSERHRGR